MMPGVKVLFPYLAILALEIELDLLFGKMPTGVIVLSRFSVKWKNAPKK